MRVLVPEELNDSGIGDSSRNSEHEYASASAGAQLHTSLRRR